MPKRKIENRKIPVILLQDHKNLGERYEEVMVAPIFARNVLFPQEIAVPANKMNRHNFAAKIAKAEKERATRVASLDEFLVQIETGGGVSFEGKVNEYGVLYAKIHEKEIAEQIKVTYNVEVNPNHIKLKKPLSEPGQYDVVYNYRDLSKTIPVSIKAENPEAIDAEKVADTEEESTEDGEETTAE